MTYRELWAQFVRPNLSDQDRAAAAEQERPAAAYDPEQAAVGAALALANIARMTGRKAAPVPLDEIREAVRKSAKPKPGG